MRTLLRSLIAGGAIVLLIVAYYFASSMRMSSEAQAQVVDAQTGQPLADAIVLVSWDAKGLEGYSHGPLVMFELTTDAHGAFTVAGWGPRFMTGFPEIRSNEPVVRIFRRGYAPAVIENTAPESRVIQLSIDGTVIKLKPSRAPLEEYARELEPLLDSIQFLYQSSHCEWQQAPCTILAMDRLKSELQGSDAARAFRSVDDIPASPQCSSGREFFAKDLQ